MKICIIGAGASGILLILLLHQNGMNLRDIAIIDPHFDGGLLQRSWGPVISNTPWIVTLGSIQEVLSSYKIPDWALALSPDKPTPLYKIAQLLRELSAPLLSKCKTVKGLVKEVIWDTTASTWTILTHSSNDIIHIQSSAVFFTQGAVPKYYDFPIPSIPLEIALDPVRLKPYIAPQDTVLVFGTSHSGTLVMKNLVDCSANSLIGVYKGATPFVWARDGIYDGIKLDAASVGDDIVQGVYPSIQLVSFQNVQGLIKETRAATWVVYAMGFTLNMNLRILVDSAEVSLKTYDPITGKIAGATKAWGFGIGYPGQAPDGIHYDVGISSFLEYISKQIPSILGSL